MEISNLKNSVLMSIENPVINSVITKPVVKVMHLVMAVYYNYKKMNVKIIKNVFK